MSSVSTSAQGKAARLQRSRRLGWIAVSLITYWVGALILLHVLRPDMNPLSRTMSEYMIGPHGWIMTTTFFALSGAVVAVARGIDGALPRATGTRTAVVLLYLAALGFALAGVFPGLIGPPQPPPPYDQATVAAFIEAAGPMHDVGSLIAFLGAAIALPLLSNRLGRNRAWRETGGLAQMLALVYVIGFLGMFAAMGLAPDLVGLVQRLTVAALLAWVLVVALGLARLTSNGGLQLP